MKKQLSFPIHPLLAAVLIVAGLLTLLLTAYGLTRWASSGEVMGRVEVEEAQLGGLTEVEALNTMSALEIGRLGRPATFMIEGQAVPLQPGETGLDIDETLVVEKAMAVGREGNQAAQFLHWLGHILATVEMPLPGTINEFAMDEVFDDWDAGVIAQPLQAGGIHLEDGVLVADYPATGVGIDRPPASGIVLQNLLVAEPTVAELPTATIQPELTDADVDAALAEAQIMLAGPITLTYDGDSTTLDQGELTGAFVSETVSQSPTTIVNSFDPAVIDQYLASVRSEFEAAPVDAKFVIHDDNTVTVQPGSNGTRIDEMETAQRLKEASFTANRTGELPIVEGAEPDLTTEYLESLNVKHLVAQFTTYHDCCSPRVTNIHLMSEAVDQTLVLPGQTFSLNDHVGERTLEKGYLPAPSIVGGEIEDTVGGGTSQFTTTLYNTVFWGGYEDVEHQPHSYYFSRYPMGIEATLFWRSIDLKFRNNRQSAVLIDTRYTDTSITVRLFGYNDGRTIVGEQSGGETHIRVASEGGADALHVKGETSDPYDIVEPGDVEYRANPELKVDQQKSVQSAHEGWTVKITRRIYDASETNLLEEQTWVHRYRPQREIIEVHPCKVPGTATACPTTTTTTTPPPPSTTTTVGETTPTG